MGAPEQVHGATAVARMFSGRALEAQPALLDGAAGVVWAPEGQPRVVWDLSIANGTIARIDMLAAPTTLAELDLVFDRP
jgi:RNA polymerase sigma-70 factor (ECF subfamily)